MKLLIAFLLLILSFNSFGSYEVLKGSSSCSQSPDKLSKAIGLKFNSFDDAKVYLVSLAVGTSCSYQPYYRYSKTSSKVVFYFQGTGRSKSKSYNIIGSSGCSSSAECFKVAESSCITQDKVIMDFQYNAPNNYTFSCDTPPDPAADCQDLITQQCSLNLGVASFDYIDDGLGNTSCTGVCNDGTNAAEHESCTLANNYCDVAEPPSDIAPDTGTDLPPSVTEVEEPVYDTEYVPDGSMADPTAPLTALQGDKLINEVIKSRNNDNKNSTALINSVNQTIVEKSDDISGVIASVGNATIDAINSQSPFYDGNIVDGLEDLNRGVGDLKDSLNSPYASGGVNDGLSSYSTLFDSSDVVRVEQKAEDMKNLIRGSNNVFYSELKGRFSFGVTGGEYTPNMMDLGRWGNHDISLSRISSFFGGIGNIVMFLASLTALSIVLGGFGRD
jgi:hypothetical protein